MTVANSVVAKLSVAFVTLAMAFTLVAPAQAQSVDDMSLEELIALVNSLQSQLGGGDAMSGGDMMTSSVCPYTWTRSLNTGDTGSDVMMLQKFLNSMPETMVAASGAGSAGMETEFYGPATGAAVANFQMKYRSEILSPLGLVNPTTFFGNSTRAQANALCVSAPAMDMGDMDGDMDGDMGDMDGDMDGNDDDDDSDNSNRDLSGSADLDTYEIEDAEDDEIEENEEDAPVAEIDIEFENGDALIEQIELGFELVSGQTGADEDQWDTFETVSLWLDGDKIAELDVDDEDDWEGSDENELTFSGLDIFAEEDEEITIIVAVTTQDGIDFDNSDNSNEWVVTIGTSSLGDDTVSINDGLRFEDGSGFIDEDEPTGTDETTFEIEEEGAEDELDVRASSLDPDSTTLQLEDDEDTSHVIFAFELDAEDSDSDIEFDQIVIDITISSGTLSDFIDGGDSRLLVDGQELETEDESVVGSTVVFDFDSGDFILEEGTSIDVELELEFNSLAAGDEGVTISASLAGNTTKIDAEGRDDLTDIEGSATGEEHTLRTAGLIFNTTFEGGDGLDEEFEIRENSDATSADDQGEFEFTFEVTAFDDDAYVNDMVAEASTSADVLAAMAGIGILVFDADGNATSTTAGFNAVIADSTAEQESSGRYRIDEGEAETFTVRAVVNPDTAGFFSVQLFGVAFSSTDQDPTEFQEATPLNDFETEEEFITS